MEMFEKLFRLNDQQVVDYLLKGDNFKRIYFQIKKQSMPDFFQSSTGLTRTGLQLTGDINLDAVLKYRDIEIYDVQTLNNIVDCLQYFYEYCVEVNLPRWTEYTLLDVGARSGVGSNFLGQIFSDNHWAFGLKLIVDALDIDESWEKFSKTQPYINQYLFKDIFTMENNLYDFCFCSHTIEHLEEPLSFIKKVNSIARKFSMFYCPYEEYDPSPASGHRMIDDAIVDVCQPQFKKIIKSVNRKRDDLYYVCFVPSESFKE